MPARSGAPLLSLGSPLIRDVPVEFLHPNGGVGVAGGAPVAAGGEGAAGADLGAVGDGGSLKLADLEETEQEHAQPAFDRGQVILPAARVGKSRRPVAAGAVAPG